MKKQIIHIIQPTFANISKSNTVLDKKKILLYTIKMHKKHYAQ